ncbi:ABC transporter substrate-binding protein [Paenibacillus sp. IB182496]|uniref:ABC transporter substrate-binding protein n=1 Tax=Paenibacillus sabuli TaxID=2772509 RepID=A0A927BQL7_9BACL|nr:ABC transporter substrate-binding protein [Paenibacillus sabuli]MBD2843754.1 ABC transporter substrate-binding protein [Paenibacillus sabuli]
MKWRTERRRGWSGLIMAAMLLLAACSGGNEDGNGAAGNSGTDGTGNATAGEAEAAAAAEKVLRIRYYDDPAGFDPATIFRVENENIAFNLFSGLTSYSPSGEIIPDLAESWETDDNMTWTFHLREGVQWQKGYGEFTAADVLYSYDRILDPATASPYASEFANVASYEATDDYTVVIKLKSPDANFLHVVANYHQGQIVKQEAVEELGDQFMWNPVGTGPYMIESMKTNSEIVMVRHEDYYRGPAPIERLVFSIIKDDDTAAIALQNGEVDLAMRIERTELLERLEADGFSLNPLYDRAVNLRIFNTDVEPLGEVKVRQAWAHAVDWASNIAATNPMGDSPTINLLPKWMEVYTDDVPVYDYDPEKAKQLLAEAGYPDGFSVTMHVRSVEEIDQLEQENLRAVGIDMQFEIVEAAMYNQIRNDGSFEVSGRQLPAINPDMILFSYLHPDNIAPNGLNGARYDNPELTELLEAARAEIDADKRKSLYAQVQRIALTDLPYIPRLSANGFWPGFDYVENVVINPLSQVNFYEVDMTN